MVRPLGNRLAVYNAYGIRFDCVNIQNYFYYMDNSSVNVQYQVIVLSDASYTFVFMGQPKIFNFDNSVIPPSFMGVVYLLMTSLEKLLLCSGVSVENYQDLLPVNDNTPVYRVSKKN